MSHIILSVIHKFKNPSKSQSVEFTFAKIKIFLSMYKLNHNVSNKLKNVDGKDLIQIYLII